MEAQKIAETLMAQAEIEKEGVSMEKEVECECFPDEIIIVSFHVDLVCCCSYHTSTPGFSSSSLSRCVDR